MQKLWIDVYNIITGEKMGERFDRNDIDNLLKVKAEIIASCQDKKKCPGFDNLHLCNCIQKFKYVKELYHSKIPKDYWLLTLKKLKVQNDYKEIINNYLEKIDNAITNGLGIMLCGPKRGIGKTSLMSVVGKKAIRKGYKVYYVIAQNILDDKFTDTKEIEERIKNCDLLLIDELDKIIMKSESNVPKQLENILRVLLPNKKAIIIATNFTEEEVDKKFSIISLIRRYMKIIAMDGQDYSKELSEKWEDRLNENSIDWNNETLIKEAQSFIKEISK